MTFRFSIFPPVSTAKGVATIALLGHGVFGQDENHERGLKDGKQPQRRSKIEESPTTDEENLLNGKVYDVFGEYID